MSRPIKAKRVRFDHWGYIFVTPFILAFLSFQAYPIVNTFYLGFTNMKGTSLEHQLVGFSNFIKSDYNLELTGKSAADANRIVAALNDIKLTADTNAPAPSDATDPFSIDSGTQDDTSASEAPADADPYSLDMETESESTDQTAAAPAEADPFGLESDTGTANASDDGSSGYYIRLNGLNSDEAAKVKTVLAAESIDAKDIESAIHLNMGGLIFDVVFWKSFWNTTILWFFNFIPQLGFALLFAVWFTDVQLKLRMTGLFKTIFYMPNLIMPASIALLFANFFGWPNGPLNLFMVQQLGLSESVNFFRSEIWTRGIVSFIQFWMWYGSSLIILIAGIVGIPDSLYESAVVDGANSRQMFTKITLPLLRPVMAYMLTTSLIGGMNMFDIPYLITNRRGAPGDSINTTFMYIYNSAFGSNNNYSYASAISIGLFILVLVLALALFYALRDKDEIAAKKMRRLAK